MKKNYNVSLEDIITSYKHHKSSYKVAKQFNISATYVKRMLKNAGILRSQKEAALERDNSSLGRYRRTNKHKKLLSDIAKTRTKDKNPFYNKKHTDEVKSKLSEYAKKRIKELNPNYKDGSYERRPRDYKIKEFTELRKFIFERDNYTCKYCGCIGFELQAHHILPFWFKKEAYLDDINLITVCNKCHFKKAHLSNWNFFDISLIDIRLDKKYLSSSDRERLNELATIFSGCDSPNSENK